MLVSVHAAILHIKYNTHIISSHDAIHLQGSLSLPPATVIIVNMLSC